MLFWHALLCAGASPKNCATSALTLAEMIQFIHLYMQLGCLACEEIIHVSDQPVAPSVGTKPSLGGLIATETFLPLSAKYWYCQVVPTQSFPLPYDWICC